MNRNDSAIQLGTMHQPASEALEVEEIVVPDGRRKFFISRSQSEEPHNPPLEPIPGSR
jgi:hypothetical protein